MLRAKTFVAGLLILILATACSSETVVLSPDGSIELQFKLINDQPFYQVKKDGAILVTNSELGFEIQNEPAIGDNLHIIDVQQSTFDETWSQPWGEVKNIRNYYNGLVVTLQEKSDLQRIVKLHFRVFDDGLGFRYEFPAQDNLKDFVITNELTAFNMWSDLKAWWIPAYGDEIDSEFLFTQNNLSEIGQKVHTPFTMEAGDSLFVSIHEAALLDYAGMTLNPVGNKLECDLVPWSTGEKVKTSAPMKTPWRTIQIAKSAGDLITSYLVLNLNEPNKLQDMTYVKPGKYNGIWWGMHLNKYTWNKGPNHGAASPVVKQYIDFAAANGLSGVLVEGWNEGWDYDWSLGRFNFTTPYPDFDIADLSQYAQEHNVGLIGHHETGGNIENYESQLPEAFAFYQKYGVHSVKTGYVTRQPSGEFHQGQFMVQHYQRVVEMAAAHQIALDIHEPVKATGLRRTYPNLMTREGARGTEYEAWSAGNPPEHTVILPFTRGLAGPLDYTPGIFDILIEERPENRVHTTLAKQLALYVTIYSPLQMAADLPENYEGQPAFQFIRDVPTDWEETRVLNAKIGDYLTIVRKDRNSDDWYLGSATDEQAKDLSIDLGFLLPNRKYQAEIYADTADTDMESNPTAIEITTSTVTANDQLELKLAPGGGQAIRFHLLE